MGQPFLQSTHDRYRDFEVLHCLKIEELDAVYREILHVPTGAQIIHIENEDPENLFCLSFRTLPKSSNGAPHILEHTVLCGSKKFPVKDPFFAMTRRSLNTYMNALTGADFTCYPAASQIEKDFYNLLEVYLDAVFHPEIKETSFLQEGIRLEFEEKDNPASALRFKGIVYNEMKGSLSSAESRLWHAVLETLLPNLPYAYNSGGEPKEIPNLTYEELLAFYREHYHPGRCLFFFYGNLSLKKHLDFLSDTSLENAKAISPLPSIQRQPRFLQTAVKRAPHPVNPSENYSNKFFFSLSWLLCPLLEQEEVLALSLLDSVLMDTDASPLRSAILDSALCLQFESYMDTEMSEVPYVFICKGCKEENIENLEKAILAKLFELSQNPLPKQWIDAALHQLELSRMEIAADGSPFGLTLFFRSALAKQHGCDPKVTLELHRLFEILVDKIRDPMYLPNLIHKYFIQNPHRAKVTLYPDPELGRREEEEELSRLKHIEDTLSNSDKEHLIAVAKKLEIAQQLEEQQSLDCLPKLTLDDVPQKTRDFPLTTHTLGSATIWHHECFTNHMLYADLLLDLPHIEKEEIPYLQLLLTLLPDLGCANRTYRENLEYIHAHTGGISVGCSLYTQVSDRNTFKPALFVRGKSLTRKTEHLLPLIVQTASCPDLRDSKRIEERIRQIHTSLQNKLNKNSSRYATQLSLSGYSTGLYFTHLSSGLPYYEFICNLVRNLEGKIPVLLQKLQELHHRLFSFHNPALIVSCDAPTYEKVLSENPLGALPSPSAYTPWRLDLTPELPVSQGRIIPAQVAYNVKSYTVETYLHPCAPALTVATQLLDNKVLHNKIREIGGAYGSGANYSSATGVFYFHSYRDPHIAHSFQAFDDSIQTIMRGKFSAQDLEEAKLGVIQQLDTPVCPGNRALLSYGWLREGKELSLRQKFREAVLTLTAKDICNALETQLLHQKDSAIEVSFAGKELFDSKGKKFPVLPV